MITAEKAERQLTAKQVVFVDELFKPDCMFNAAMAYKIAYPLCKSGYNKHGSRLMANDGIKQAIEVRRQEIAAQTGYTREIAQAEYEEDRQLARRLNQPAAAVSAVTGKAKLHGYGLDKGGDTTIAVVNIINYAGAAGVPAPAVVAEVVDEQDNNI